MIEFLKVTGGRVHNDGPTPREITNHGPDELFVGGKDVSAGDFDEKVKVDGSVTLDGEAWLWSPGKSRVSVAHKDPAGIRIQEIERRLDALEGSSSKSSRKNAK